MAGWGRSPEGRTTMRRWRMVEIGRRRSKWEVGEKRPLVLYDRR
jgi:hypothetical protein